MAAKRYKRGGVPLTTNLPFSNWKGIFKVPMTTAAVTGRLKINIAIDFRPLSSIGDRDNWSIDRTGNAPYLIMIHSSTALKPDRKQACR